MAENKQLSLKFTDGKEYDLEELENTHLRTAGDGRIAIETAETVVMEEEGQIALGTEEQGKIPLGRCDIRNYLFHKGK